MLFKHSSTLNPSRIPAEIRHNIALNSLSGRQTVADIAQANQCCRNTVYNQRNKALGAIQNAYSPANDEVLFMLPVTAEFIKANVLALYLDCKASYRDIKLFMQDIYKYKISEGSICNIIDEVIDSAIQINKTYDLSKIVTSASDEVYQNNKPILTVVDIVSRYCAMADIESSCDGDTWAIKLLYLKDQGYAPEITIIDGAKGMTNGYKQALSETKIQYDHFHFIRDMKDCKRFLKNQIASKITSAAKLERKLNREKNPAKKVQLEGKLTLALNDLLTLDEVCRTFSTLEQWLQYDVLQLAGYSPDKRAELYDFIISEMKLLKQKFPHRITKVYNSLKHQRNALLGVSDILNIRFSKIADQFNISLDAIWDICYLARYGYDSHKYHEQSTELEAIIGSQYDSIEDEVLTVLDSTHRCSSMVENLHSRLRPYILENKPRSQRMLGLIIFHLNHKPFLRSANPDIKGKTAAHALTGQEHAPWLEMLGFHIPQPIAA